MSHETELFLAHFESRNVSISRIDIFSFDAVTNKDLHHEITIFTDERYDVNRHIEWAAF